MTRLVVLKDFLTDSEILECIRLREQHGSDATRLIAERIIAPNLERIDRSTGQDNDAMYLAYAVEYALMRCGL
jgi:hypothetical protein